MLILFGTILGGIAFVLQMVLSVAIILVIVSALISWVNPDPYNPIVRFLRAATDPLLRPIRRRVPLIGGGIDISPLILILVLYFLQYVLVQSLQHYAHKVTVMGGGNPFI